RKARDEAPNLSAVCRFKQALGRGCNHMVSVTPEVRPPGRIYAAPLQSPRSSAVFAYNQPLLAEPIVAASEFHHDMAHRNKIADLCPSNADIFAPLDAGLASPSSKRFGINYSQSERRTVCKRSFFMQELPGCAAVGAQPAFSAALVLHGVNGFRIPGRP